MRQIGLLGWLLPRQALRPHEVPLWAFVLSTTERSGGGYEGVPGCCRWDVMNHTGSRGVHLSCDTIYHIQGLSCEGDIFVDCDMQL